MTRRRHKPGKYSDYVHKVGERWVIATRNIVGGLDRYDVATSYANPNAAIKAARRIYPELRKKHPWKTDEKEKACP